MKIMLVSFFVSNNLGDLLISDIFANKMETYQHEVIKYDFLEVKRIEIVKKQIDFTVGRIEEGKGKTIVKNILGDTGKYLKYKVNKSRKDSFKKFEIDLEDCEMVYFAGGNMIMDIVPVWPLILQDYVKILLKKGIPYCFLAIGVGPVIRSKSKRIFKFVLNGADKISVRGDRSGRVLEEIGIQSFQVDIDPVLALHLDKIDTRRKRIESFEINKKAVIGVGILERGCFESENVYKKYVADTIQMIQNLQKNSRIKEIVLYSTEILDYETIEIVYAAIDTQSIRVFKGKCMEEIMELYDNLDYIIGARMHSLILAQRCMVPFLCIFWQPKIEEFCLHVNAIKDMILLDDIRKVDIDSLNLEAKISMAWLERTIKLNEELEERLDAIFR